ncbi:MAG TPA: hypothetical protein VMT90_04000 [Dehalococcoidia bacterium]|nr:hypothetical protein [Dehalococcoidia bacterium]
MLAFVPELLTSVRIESGVQRLGGFLEVAESPDAFVRGLKDTPALAIFDLSVDWIDLNELVRVCMSAGVPLLAFGPHVDTGRLREARQAGVDFVYPRSKFMSDVAGTIREVLAGART